MRERFGSLLGARRRDSGGKNDSVRSQYPVSRLFSQNNFHSEPPEGFRSLAINNHSHRPEKLPRHPQEGGAGPVLMVYWVAGNRGTCDGEVLKPDPVLVDQLRAIPVGRQMRYRK